MTNTIEETVAKNGLMTWPLNVAIKYLKETLKDEPLTTSHLNTAKGLHKELKDSAAATGTIVHALINQRLDTGQPELDKYRDNPEVMNAYLGFVEWLHPLKYIVRELEQTVYSEQYNYAGKLDAVMTIESKNYLVDFKTTKANYGAPRGVYAEHFIQIGAYAMAYNEQRDYECQNGGTKLVELEDLMVLSVKKDGKVDAITASEIGLSIGGCINLWKNVHEINTDLKNIRQKLG